jgi:prepilin-type N-terminal cleavage/methylation domain-containing protein
MIRMTSHDTKGGFTLLEVLAVIVIMTMMIAIVGVQLNGPYQVARLRESLERIEFIDNQVRNHSLTHSTPCQLVVDLDRGHLYSQDIHDDDLRSFEYHLPRKLRFDRFQTPWLDKRSGSAVIDITARGSSPTYAVCVVAPDDERRWVLFAGATGRADHSMDKENVQQVFALWRASGVNTD